MACTATRIQELLQEASVEHHRICERPHICPLCLTKLEVTWWGHAASPSLTSLFKFFYVITLAPSNWCHLYSLPPPHTHTANEHFIVLRILNIASLRRHETAHAHSHPPTYPPTHPYAHPPTHAGVNIEGNTFWQVWVCHVAGVGFGILGGQHSLVAVLDSSHPTPLDPNPLHSMGHTSHHPAPSHLTQPQPTSRDSTPPHTNLSRPTASADCDFTNLQQRMLHRYRRHSDALLVHPPTSNQAGAFSPSSGIQMPHVLLQL